MINKHTLVGNVGLEPPIRTTETSGVKFAQVRLITNYRKKINGEYQEHSEGHNVICWDRLAEIVERHVTKGTRLYVEGPSATRKYQKDGEDRYITEVTARELKILSGWREDSEQAKPEYEDQTGEDVPF